MFFFNFIFSAAAMHEISSDIQGPPIQTTHVQRHPEIQAQPVIKHNKRILSEAQKASLEIEQERILEKIADEEGVMLEHCHQLLSTSLKKKCKPNARNALVSLKALELNVGRCPGEKAKLHKIQVAVAADDTMQDPSPEALEKARELLEEKRLAQAQDQEVHLLCFALCYLEDDSVHQFFNLNQQTGAIGFGFVTRAAVDCSTTPCWFASGNAVEFVKEYPNQGMWDLLRGFESWAVAALTGPAKGPSNINDRKKACAAMILSNLAYITNGAKVPMSYVRFNCEIILAHKIHLIGWPAQVPFVAPSTLTRNSDILDL
ncbi:hypothetical protein C8J56DRAFT_1051181 [Mycena floridula]|nr:hypothetical protein C8J56DRAFT_1051181 [Mycena floridula]